MLAQAQALREFYGKGLDARKLSVLPLDRFSLQLKALLEAHKYEGTVFGLQLAAIAAQDYGSDSDLVPQITQRFMEWGSSDVNLKLKLLNLLSSNSNWRFANDLVIPVWFRSLHTFILDPTAPNYVDPRKVLCVGMPVVFVGASLIEGIYRVTDFGKEFVSASGVPASDTYDVSGIIPLNSLVYDVLDIDVNNPTNVDNLGRVVIENTTVIDKEKVVLLSSTYVAILEYLKTFARWGYIFNAQQVDGHYRIDHVDSAAGVVYFQGRLNGLSVRAPENSKVILELGDLVAATKVVSGVTELYLNTKDSLGDPARVLCDASPGDRNEVELTGIKKSINGTHYFTSVRQYDSSIHKFSSVITHSKGRDAPDNRGFVTVNTDLTSVLSAGDVVYIFGTAMFTDTTRSFYEVYEVTPTRVYFTTSLRGGSGNVTWGTLGDIVIPPKLVLSEDISEKYSDYTIGEIERVTTPNKVIVSGDVRDRVFQGDWVVLNSTTIFNEYRCWVSSIQYTDATRIGLYYVSGGALVELEIPQTELQENAFLVRNNPTLGGNGEWVKYVSYGNLDINVTSGYVQVTTASNAEVIELLMTVVPGVWLDVEWMGGSAGSPDGTYRVKKTEFLGLIVKIYMDMDGTDRLGTDGILRISKSLLRQDYGITKADVVYPPVSIGLGAVKNLAFEQQNFKYQNQNNVVLKQNEPYGIQLPLMNFGNVVSGVEEERVFDVKAITTGNQFGFDLTGVVNKLVVNSGGKGRVYLSVDSKIYVQPGATVYLDNKNSNDGTFQAYSLGADGFGSFVELTTILPGRDMDLTPPGNMAVRRKLYSFSDYIEDGVVQISVANSGSVGHVYFDPLLGDITDRFSVGDCVYLLSASFSPTTLDYGDYYVGLYKVASALYLSGSTSLVFNLSPYTQMFGVNRSGGGFKATIGLVESINGVPVELDVTNRQAVIIEGSLSRKYILKQDMRVENTPILENSELVQISEISSCQKARDVVLSRVILVNGKEDFADKLLVSPYYEKVGDLNDRHGIILGTPSQV